MKKTAIVLVVILCMMLAVGLTACNGGGKLDTPKNVTINNDTLSWDEVKNANSYIVEIDDGKDFKEVTGTSFSYGASETSHKMRVKAKGEGKYKDSDFSESFTYVPTKRLSAPTLSVAVEGNNATFSWTKVENATGYKIKIGTVLLDVDWMEVGADVLSKTVNIKDDASFNKIGEYEAIVVATSNDDKYIDSIESNLVSYVNTKQLAKPTDFKFESGNFKWNTPDTDDGIRFKLVATEQGTTENPNVVEYDAYSSKSINYKNLNITKAGTYKVKVYAYHYSQPNVYLQSFDMSDEEQISITILPNVSNFKLVGSTLKWDAVASAKNYTITAETTRGTTITMNSDNTEYDLAANKDFRKADYVYRVFTFKIVANGDVDNRIFGSGETVLDKGAYYQYIASETDYTDETLKDDKAKVFPVLKKDENNVPLYYEVTNYPQLMWAIRNGAKETTEIRLMNNIEIPTTEFVSVATTFKATFNGNGYTISRIVMTDKFTRTDANFSIFGINDGTIKDLTIAGVQVKVTGDLATGLLAKTNNGTIDKVIISGATGNNTSDTDMTLFGNSHGAAFVYDNKGTIESSIANIDVQAKMTAGIAVKNFGTISNVTAYGSSVGASADGPAVVGGIVAINSGDIVYGVSHASVLVNTVNSDKTKADAGVTGGLVGVNEASGKISYSYFTGNVTVNASNDGVKAYGGGFVGHNKGNISTSYVDSHGKIDKQSDKAITAGFAGLNDGDIVSVYSNIFISKIDNNAAFVAVNNGNITKSAYNVGKVHGLEMTISGKKGNVDAITAGFESNKMDDAVKVLGDEFIVNNITNVGMPILKNAIYMQTSNIVVVRASVNLGDKDMFKNYYQGGEMKVVTDEHQLETQKHVGYQILRYQVDLDGGKSIVYNRLVRVE